MGSFHCGTQSKQLQNNIVVEALQEKNLIFDIFLCLGHLSANCLLFIVLFAKNSTNQIKSNYLNSHGEEAQEQPPGL